MLWPHQHAKLAQLAARNGKTIAAKPRPRGENVVDLMDALKKSIAGEASPAKGKKPRKAAAGQKEMLLPIEGKGRAQKKKPLNPNGRPDAARRDMRCS